MRFLTDRTAQRVADVKVFAKPLAYVSSAKLRPANTLRLLLPPGMVAYAVVVAAVVLLETPATYRAPLVLLFVVLGPGAAVVLLLRIAGLLMQLMLTVTVSLALGVLVPSGMLYAGLWWPRAALVALALITGMVSIAAFMLELRRVRSPQPGSSRAL